MFIITKTKHKEFIYETGTNAIYSDGNYFYLLHRRTGIQWKFDRDNRVLAGLIEFLNSSGAIVPDGRNWHSDTRIAPVMWELYHPYEGRGDRKVLYADGNATNLTFNNLYLRGQCMPMLQNRRIWHSEDRIFVRCLCNEALFFTDFEPELFDLLCCTSFYAWYVAKPKRYCGYRLMAEFDKMRVSLGELVYYYYNYGLRVSNIAEILPKAKSEIAPNGLEIDHLRNNPCNNTLHNLVLMPKALNAKKKDLVTRICVPFWFVPVQKDGKIRVSLGDTTTPGTERFILCENANVFVDLLVKYQKECFLSKKMLNRSIEQESTRSISQMLVDDGKLLQNGKYNIIEVLLNMNEEQFEVIAI